ncbi:carbamoyltransferase [Streptomyces sp. NPDC059627]
MLVLGLNGNVSPADSDVVPNLNELYMHDAAATLVRDGVLVAAVEEERLNRIKKTTKFPGNAIRECLVIAGATPADVDAIGYYFPEEFFDDIFQQLYTDHPKVPTRYSREMILERLRIDLDWTAPPEILHYVPHHLAHATSTYYRSGMTEALVVVMDGAGESSCCTIYRSNGAELLELASYPVPKSLGQFYLYGTRHLGYGFGDEYKVMGLAPYGDPSTYREVFSTLHSLGPNGTYELVPRGGVVFRMTSILRQHGLQPRRRGEPFTQAHMDFAASIQETTEKIAMHVIGYWARCTGLRNLAFGGGVAHNSTLNGRILASGLFDEVFIHPASHDSGSSEGAALIVESERGGRVWPVPRLTSASLGPDLGDLDSLEQTLKAWSPLVDVERPDDVVEATAHLLAAGEVIGWAHGRSEFGPRALGNRSILADARPKENQTRINAMVKKRESFRPFAPVVTAESVADYFDLPETLGHHDFMSFVVQVRADRRELLGAVTHVDGSARLQVVAEESNPRFHRLVTRFGELTGTPVLLNTSFNNNAEPIVQSVEDVLASYLTTSLDVLVIEDFVVRRRTELPLELEDFTVGFRPVTRLVRRLARASANKPGDPGVSHEIYLEYTGGPHTAISAAMYDLLTHADGVTPLARLGVDLTEELLTELYGLWQERFVIVGPVQPE